MYGSTLASTSPGRNPRRSPASTAGRVRMMRPTCFSARAATASAIARYVLPVPAGPMPKVTVQRLSASTYRFCVTVFEDVADFFRLVERSHDGVDRARPDLVAALHEVDELVDHRPRAGHAGVVA